MTDIGPSTCTISGTTAPYPIELQLWCGQDYQFNIWSHRYVYKYHPAQVGRALHQAYCAGMLPTEQAFLARLTQEVENRG